MQLGDEELILSVVIARLERGVASKYASLALQSLGAAVYWLRERDFVGPRQPA